MASQPSNRDPYELLQVHKSAEIEVIEAAYKRLAMKYHPDHYKGADATQRMQDINWARSVLTDATQRNEYDRQMGRNETRTTAPSAEPTTGTSATRRPETNDGLNSTPQQTQTVVFSSSFDSKRCGNYGLDLNGQRLVVTEGGGRQNHYDVSNLQANQWFALRNSKGEQLPVYLQWNNLVLQARVGTPPPGRISVLTVRDYSTEWQFEPRLGSLYTHPEGGFRLRYMQIYPWSPKYIEVTTSLNTINFETEKWPQRKWIELRHPQGGVFPLSAFKDNDRLQMKWLPLNTVTHQNDSASAPENNKELSTGPNKSDVLKAVGSIALIGLAAAADWLSNRSKDKKR